MFGYENEEGDGDQSVSEVLEEKAKKKKSKKGQVEEKKENFILFLARFGMTMMLKEDGTKLFMTDIHGTMVLQQLLEFHKPFKVYGWVFGCLS